MNRIVLSRLVLKNFKGIRDLIVDFSDMTEVYGDNATGKTTLFDAFCWLLFDKDSQNKKDFDIKTLDGQGNVLRGLDHEVEGTLLIDGRPIVLRKLFAEKWTKKRGSATEEFTGHTTDYFIDGVPVKQKEFKERIDRLIDENVFKLLTNPTYFNEQMDWKARRKTLLSVCGDVSDDEVISANNALSRLPSILGTRALEDHRKVVAARRAEINKELEKIPVRIDEAERSKPDTGGLSEGQLQSEISRLKLDVEDKEGELSRLHSGGEVAVQEKLLRETEGELINIKNRIQESALHAVSQQRGKLLEATSEVNKLDDEIQRIERRIESNASTIAFKKDDADRLRRQWSEVNAEELEHNHDENCPTCGQALLEERVKAAHEKALANFNRQKSERLERITAQGQALMEEVKKLDDENTALSSQIDELRWKLASAQESVASAQLQLDQLQAGVKDPLTDAEYVAKQHQWHAITQRISALRSSVLEDTQRVRSQLNQLRDAVREKEQEVAGFAQVRMLDERVAELKHQERQLAAEYERLEEELYLTEEFIRTKVNILEERINNKFKYARFKLFDHQINGGLAETCETLYQGVPYGSGLNNAARINVGLDIINTLSEHYGLLVPIFVDNAEAVTRLAETVGQVIALYVSEPDKRLRIETTGRVQEAV